MIKIDSEIVREASEFVTDLLEEKLSGNIEFHTIDHTKYVVSASELIGKNSGLSHDEIELVKLCAWFHDTGYIISPENHERQSARIAVDFLSSKGIDKNIIDKVKNCILATRIPQLPIDTVSKVLCDADLMHLADDNYFELIENMRKEWNNLSGNKISKRKFHISSEKFFKKHIYHTDFARRELQPQKDIVLKSIQAEIEILGQQKNPLPQIQKKKKAKSKRYSRGVDSMFKLTARNQINLSSIADNKSNMLISVNAIIISIIMSIMVTRFEELPDLVLPTIVFLGFCLATIVFAILSTRPNISSGTFTKGDIEQNKVNLLFFGNFYNMQLDEYEEAIAELMKNDKNLYSTMIKDQYSLGKVLAKKYKLLRIAYHLFMFGIIISVISYLFAFINV